MTGIKESWIPDWASHYSIERMEGEHGIEIRFYSNDHITIMNALPIERLKKDLIDADVLQQIREKQPRYTGADGLDHIDRAFEKMSKASFWGAMRFTIEKYLDRLGKKDDTIKELEKVCDYAERWKQCEIKRINEKA